MNSPINPHSSEIFFCEFHDSVEPFPKSKTSVRKWFFTELRPSYHQIGAVGIVTHVPKTKSHININLKFCTSTLILHVRRDNFRKQH